MSGGCMGICQDRTSYKFEVQKNVTGTDTFVTVFTHETRFIEKNATVPTFCLTTSKLCNANFDTRIRFSLTTATMNGKIKIFNYFESSLN